MFIYLWLPWVFVAECRLSLVAVSSGLLSSCGVLVFHDGGVPCCGGQVAGKTWFSVVPAQSSVIVVYRLGCVYQVSLSGPRMEPVSKIDRFYPMSY